MGERQMVLCRGLRGATTVEHNEPAEIVAGTVDLLRAMIDANGLRPADVASAIFTVTPDLNAAYPALAARELGWTQVALMCATEIAVPGSLPLCIRVLIHWNTDRPQGELRHVYLHGATVLRPDLVCDPMPSTTSDLTGDTQ